MWFLFSDIKKTFLETSAIQSTKKMLKLSYTIIRLKLLVRQKYRLNKLTN